MSGRNVLSGLFWIAVGLLLGWATWHVWGQFAQLESGKVASVRIWAPLAWIYNLGGIWSPIAKWSTVALMGFGAGAVTLAGIASFLPDKEPAERER